MDRDTFLSKIKEIGALEDIAIVRDKLTELSDDVEKNIYDSLDADKKTIDELNQKIAKNNEDMEKLRTANMNLFLRIGEQKADSQIKRNSTGIKDPDEDKLTYEDLFKEEGDGK